MTTHEAPPTSQSVIDVLRGLLADVIRFGRAEFKLVQAEGKEAAVRALIGSGLVAAAIGFFGLFFVFALGAGAVEVGQLLGLPWLGWLIFAGVFLLIALVIGWLGIRRIKSGIREGKGAFTTVREDLEWVKQFDAPLVAQRFVDAISVL